MSQSLSNYNLINHLSSITKLVIKYLLAVLTVEAHVTCLEELFRQRACRRIPGKGGGVPPFRSDTVSSLPSLRYATMEEALDNVDSGLRDGSFVNFVIASEGTHAQ